MSASVNLQIPSADSAAPSSSRHHHQQHYSSSANSARPVSVAVQPSPSPSQHHSTSTRRHQRASHTPVSSHAHSDDPPTHVDVYAHPAAVAYAAAHPRRQIPKFGPYLLLQTLGEGEFGKVKLGLHTVWGEEVAVKLIRRGNVDSAVRMSKIEREIEVLRILKHPNIVRLYDVIETDKYIGIILEYASGGELFDHILAHRYLRERDAAKLFSQLISGVWYIHQKKIVHRDLKLENLLLDRNRNVIITDFGFANRFEHRSDDLMQTSCGSPCYAAPELVISEGLYVGSAVDIWSCGVILYAMLAGYLPFDDDPANPDGDNINLLYKYIVSTPLSFPDYISNEARDLLKIMLVPDPARRASLQDVMKHPWLSTSIQDDRSGVSRAFGRTVEDLERVALEQHQQKRLAYQKQMKALASESAAVAPPDPRAARSLSYRPAEPAQNVPVPSSSRSKSSQPAQSDYIYQSSTAPPDLSAAAFVAPSHTDTGRRAHGSPSAPVGVGDADPFAGPGSNKVASKRAPETLSPQPQQGKGHHQKAATTPETQFRHTIQVEYDAPAVLPKGSKKAEEKEKKATRDKPSSQGSASLQANGPPSHPLQQVNENGTATPTQPQQRSTREKRVSTSNPKPLPLPPVPSSTFPTGEDSHASSGIHNSTPIKRGAVASPDSTPQPPAKIPIVNIASPPETPSRGTANREASGESVSIGSASSKKSHKKGGASVDKIGFAKFFGGGSNASTEHTERAPSDAPSAASSLLLSPSGSEKERDKDKDKDGSKKGRRNTLTVMVEPIINRTMRGRTTKGRPAVTPTTAEEANAPNAPLDPVKSRSEKDRAKEKVKEEEKERSKSARIPQTAVMEKPLLPGELGGGERDSSGLQASTKKAIKVMQWFRTKSKGTRDSLGPEPMMVHDKSAAAPPVQVFVTTPATPTTAARPPVSGIYSTPRQVKPSLPQRAASTNTTESSLPTPSLVKRFRNSVTIATGGTPFSSGSHSPGKNKTAGVMRVHHGAVDQALVTTSPPAEVISLVRGVLEGMGLEIQVETQFKFKCIRPKKKKGVVGGGMGSMETAGGSSGSGGLAAVTMMGSAASNGVDKRGLPLPSQSTFSATGGMLRGLLMRRQSSQVSSSATTPSTAGNPNQSLSFDDETSVVIGEPVMINDTAYGDLSEDAGDEVRFSVELTRIDRLNDMYSLDVRRLKGTLRSYKYLYDTLRQRANLQR